MLSILLLLAAPGFDNGNFENFGLAPGTFLNNAGGGASGFFNSGNNQFNNSFDPSFGGIWSGFSVSNVADPNTAGFGNQYAAKPGSGEGGSATYGVAFTFGDAVDPLHPDGSFVNLADGTYARSIAVANTTYAYFSMLNGDQFSSAFTAANNDYFLLTITGYSGFDGEGASLGRIDFYLADFRNGAAYIRDDWQSIDLTSLGNARSLRFGLSSNDNGFFGMNTPAFFAVDELVVAPIPEPGTMAMALLVGLVCIRFRKPIRKT